VPSAKPDSKVLPDAGLVVLRRGTARVTLDAGPLGDDRLAAHGHADALAVSLSVGAAYLVGDPGTGTYFQDAGLRTALRGTGAHATVLVDGVDQSEQAAAFLWGRRATSRLGHVDLDRGLAIASHDGYLRLPDPVLHRRAVLLLEAGLLVYDRLEASARHTYSQRWPMPPWIHTQCEANRVLCVGPTFAATLAVATSVPSELRVIQGSHEPREGWWSPHFQAVEPAPWPSLDFTGSGVVHAAAFIAVAADSSSPPELSIELVERGRTASIDVVADNTPFSFTFDLDASAGRQVIEGILTAATE
jgi:hypothetical protein